MLRLVVDSDGQLCPDLAQKLPGRGAYLCMQQGCLSRLNDKRLRVLTQKYGLALPQWGALKVRLSTVMEGCLKQLFGRVQVNGYIGRDAVMHRLWKNAPLLLLIAADSGEALHRQVVDAVRKREQDGKKVVLVEVGSKSWLGEKLGRENVAVAGMDASGPLAVIANRLKQYCVWHGQIKALG